MIHKCSNNTVIKSNTRTVCRMRDSSLEINVQAAKPLWILVK